MSIEQNLKSLFLFKVLAPSQGSKVTLQNLNKYRILIPFAYMQVLPKQKLLLIMGKCQKFLLKLVVKSAMLATILENSCFLCKWLSIFPE